MGIAFFFVEVITYIYTYTSWRHVSLCISPLVMQQLIISPTPGCKVPAIRLHWENYIFISFHIEWDMVVVTVFLSILNRMVFHLIQNRKEYCHHDHIPFNVKRNRIRVFSVNNHPHLQTQLPAGRVPSQVIFSLLLYFLFIIYLIQFTLPNVPSISSQAFLLFWCSCHRSTTFRQEYYIMITMRLFCTSLLPYNYYHERTLY